MLDLDALMRPRSVAVVGANDDCDTFGGRIWHYLDKYSNVAKTAVNVRAGALKDDTVVPTLSDLAQTPDVVVLATPAATVRDLVSESISIGARAALVFSQVPRETTFETLGASSTRAA